ncbi:outer membrane protein/peptidoglycan-associated (lipo)protein [Rivularia sp. PCC 7116]|uniref:OmpA family protein n=1 Tax=Rivularia sp. PCC 7116 TaxID=373994 RepID=UPI00029F4C9F|nr:OmpA family protein [Rivularia sp. PCC 7116]AFY56597.1 outer membrane protein/peptidoglycan-associated (lipo)protein [Rivularia sp. PCC 7116]
MSDKNGNRLAEESFNNNHIEGNNGANELSELSELSQLRSLLLGIEEPKLHRFYEKLDNPQVDPEDISKMLPEAVVLRTMQDEQLSEALIPTVEQAIQSSIKKDINVLSEAIFPIIGPATRKAIATALDEMVQSFNYALEHSLSLQSLKWRIEAKQTGKSFAEVVLLRTLIYRVEQVFLIDKNSGLIIQHLVAPKVSAQDPSLVSAMLTAIQDFVKDSFNVTNHEGLDTLEFGELTIWIEQGPTSVLAGIIRGNAPEDLRIIFQNAIEKIHLKFGREINNFSGDTKPFEASKPYLEACLEAHYEAPTRTRYIYAWTSIGILALVLGCWGFFAIRGNKRWDSYVQSLQEQPGIIVTKAEERNGKYLIAGMRDPLAVEPNTLIKASKLNPKAVVHQWKPFISLERKIAIKRASKLLEKPKTVDLTLNENGVLQATGSATSQWIKSARNKKPSLSIIGIVEYQDENLKNLDIDQLNAYKKEIEETIVLFEQGTTQLIPGEAEKLYKLSSKLQNLIDAGKSLNKQVQFEIAGHTDTEGDETLNIKLSQNRAQKIFNYLQSQGIDRKNFSTKAFGAQKILRPESTPEDKKINRRVSFKVIIDDVVQ